MKMNRALSLAMAGALGLSLLAGCGGGSGSPPTPLLLPTIPVLPASSRLAASAP